MATQNVNTQQFANYSTLQKWEAFANGTFKFLQPLPAVTLTEDTNHRFTLPKSRYTSRVYLMVSGTTTLTHSSATTWASVKHRYAPYNLIKNVKVDSSGLTTMINMSGIGINEMNRCTPNDLPYNEATVTTTRNMTTLTDLVASSNNTVTFNFLLDVSFMINNRDYIGLINTADQNINVNFEVLTGNAEDMFTATTGYTVGTPSWTMTPIIETYQPVVNTLVNADPSQELIDFKTIKMWQQQPFTIASSGEFIIKMPVGQTYRRIILDFYGSATGTALTDAQVTKLSLSLNQADTPIVIPTTALKSINHLQFGGANARKAGMYVIDLTEQGFINYGGNRDYIQTYGLNEFWIRAEIASGVTGTVVAYYETLQQLA